MGYDMQDGMEVDGMAQEQTKEINKIIYIIIIHEDVIITITLFLINSPTSMISSLKQSLSARAKQGLIMTAEGC